MSAYFVPVGALQYSTQFRASSGVPVPRLTASIGDQSILRHKSMNSSVPNSLVSILDHASSRSVGRSALSPTPSSQWYPETKLPPGYRMTGIFSWSRAPRTSVRNPVSSA